MRAVVVIGISLVVSSIVHGQEPDRSPDRVISVDGPGIARFESTIAPFVEMARATYGDAKARFLAGLPRNYDLFVTTDLFDPNGKKEQAFVLVRSIADDRIEGVVASDIAGLSSYSKGDVVSLREAALKDWTIVAPDGAEEGNFIGKFLDHYEPGKQFVVVFAFTVEQNGRARDAHAVLLTDETEKPLSFTLPPDWLAAAARAIEQREWVGDVERDARGLSYLPFIYDPERPTEPVGVP